jgi:class 3 adenylate cyclase
MAGIWVPDAPVTIVFSDVVGSTDLRTQRDDLTAHQLLRAYEGIVRRCVAVHDGRQWVGIWPD